MASEPDPFETAYRQFFDATQRARERMLAAEDRIDAALVEMREAHGEMRIANDFMGKAIRDALDTRTGHESALTELRAEIAELRAIILKRNGQR